MAMLETNEGMTPIQSDPFTKDLYQNVRNKLFPNGYGEDLLSAKNS